MKTHRELFHSTEPPLELFSVDDLERWRDSESGTCTYKAVALPRAAYYRIRYRAQAGQWIGDRATLSALVDHQYTSKSGPLWDICRPHELDEDAVLEHLYPELPLAPSGLSLKHVDVYFYIHERKGKRVLVVYDCELWDYGTLKRGPILNSLEHMVVDLSGRYPMAWQQPLRADGSTANGVRDHAALSVATEKTLTAHDDHRLKYRLMVGLFEQRINDEYHRAAYRLRPD